MRLFDPSLQKGLLTDWCQEGMGHILAQKHCTCPSSPINLNCCKDGWKVCSVGSRFCTKAESNYSPTEGEFTALVEGLEKTAYFTLGCASVSVGTDHKPLIPMINGTDLSSVKTPRQHQGWIKNKNLNFLSLEAHFPNFVEQASKSSITNHPPPKHTPKQINLK